MRRIYLLSFIGLIALYIILTFALPIDPSVLARYSITDFQLKLLNLSIVAPLVIIYIIAFRGFLRINDYAHQVNNTNEGSSFKNIATGLMVLVFGLPINSIIGAFRPTIRHQYADLLPAFTTFRSYVALIFAAISLLLIARGASHLYTTLKLKNKARVSSLITLGGPIFLACMFTWLITSQTLGINNERASYLPQWLLIMSLVIPYVFIWCSGIRASYQLFTYKNGVKGIIYKQSFENLSKGLVTVIVVSILIQFVTYSAEGISRLTLTPLLLIVYLLITLYAVGFSLVGSSAKKLIQIEEA